MARDDRTGCDQRVAIVVLVLVTAYYAWQTRQMAIEMRQARLLQPAAPRPFLAFSR